MAGRTFRTRLSLRVAIWLAAALWGAVLTGLVLAPGAERRTVLSATAFVAFFGAFGFVHARTWIAVTAEGVVAATPFRIVAVAFAEIERLVVQDGPTGRLYAVRTPRGPIRFTSLLAHHRELCQLIVDRAGLAPG